MQEFLGGRSELNLDEDRYEVLAAVRDHEGNFVGDWIAQELLFNPKKKKAFLCGSPESSKSTQISQLVERIGELADSFQIPIKLYVNKYEAVLEIARGVIGVDENGEVEEQGSFNELLIKCIEGSNRLVAINVDGEERTVFSPSEVFVFGPEDSNERKEISLNEVPAVGDRDVKDMGISAVEHFIGDDDVLFQFNWAADEVRRRATQLRLAVESESTLSRIPQIVREVGNIVLPSRFKDNISSGAILKAIINRTARDRHIIRINSEIRNLVFDWFRDTSISDIVNLEVVLPENWSRKLTEEHNIVASENLTKMIVAYFVDWLRSRGVSGRDGKVVLVPFIDRPIHWNPEI